MDRTVSSSCFLLFTAIFLVLQLKLSRNYAEFTFVKEPVDAAKMLNEQGDTGGTAALDMIMNQASNAPATDDPAKARKYKSKSLVDSKKQGVETNKSGEEKGSKKDKTSFHDEAALKQKGSADSAAEQVGITCCCSFW
jgi:hypothetical protein